MTEYDVVIIGGGLGGLACGSILSREGMKVCILEKSKVLGGCLQSFHRNGHTLDTGMHFVGSLDEGKIMRQYFKFFGIEKKLKLKKMDEEAFDIVSFENGVTYKHASGIDNYKQTMIDQFPDEQEGITKYCKLLQEIGDLISPELLRTGSLAANSIPYMCLSAHDEIFKLIKNPTLRNVIFGNSVYDMILDKTSLYEHCMINKSNIDGAYRFVGGTQHIADALAETIRENGGEIFLSAPVKKIHLTNDRVSSVEIENSEQFFTKSVISSIHPTQTYAFLDKTTKIKKAFYNRLLSLENSYGIFTTYLIMKPGKFKYQNRNHFLYNTTNVWTDTADYKGINLLGLMMSMQPVENSEYAEIVSLMMPIFHDEFDKWKDTYTGRRGEEYEEYKQTTANAMIDFATQWFPDLKAGIDKVYTASPLTYRDYTSTPNGSAYGILKDYHNPIVSHIPTQTRIPNLYLTGQNINVHGCLGVSVTAALTCSKYLGMEYIAKKISEA